MALNLIDTPTEQAAKSAEQLGKEIFVLQTKTESLTQAQYEQLEGIYKSTAGTDEFAKSIENLNIAQINGLETTYKTILASQNLSEERKKEIETNLKLLDSKRNEILLSESLERISQETDLKRLQREQRQAEKAGLTVGDDINVKKSEARLAKIKELEKLENESFKDKIKMQDATQAEIDKNATKALEKRAEITNDYFNNIDDILETADKLTEKQTFNIFDDYFEDIDTLLEKQDQLTANAFNDKIISDLNNVYEIQSLNNEMLFDEARAAAIKRGDTAEQLAELEKQIEIDKTEFAIIQASARLEVYKKLGIFTEAELLSIEASISALNVKLLELGNKDGDKKFLANLLGVTDEEAAAITEKTGELILKLGDIVSEQQKRKLAEMDEEIAKNEEVIKSLQTKYDTEKELGEKGIANNANKLKAEIILEKKKNEELIAERKKLAKKNQLIMISEAIIAGSLAAIKALDGPPIIKWIELAAINVQTIANVATIKSQKFAQGGSGILQGNSHAEGGIPFDGNKEAEGGEMFGFIKKSKVSRYKTDFKNIVSDMNNGTYMPTFEGNQNVIVNNDYNLLIQKQEETNRILSEIYNKPEKHYENGKLKIERIGNKTIFFQ
jgi:UDP-N-acetylglucosamine transferase subunit ALG13